jgi:phage gpG-like protein
VGARFIEVDAQGFEELKAELRALSRDMSDLDMAQTAQVGAALARSLAPRRTGRLAGSIQGHARKNKAVVVARAVYAAGIEYGTPSRHMRAEPFMRPIDPRWTFTATTDLQTVVDKHIAEQGLS